MKVKIKWVLVGLGLAVIWGLGQWPDGRLHVVFCDVGQGDGILMSQGNWQVLVDGGKKGERVLSCLGENMAFWDRKIEMVVSTHGEKDHLGGLDEVLDRYEVGKLVVGSVQENEGTMELVRLAEEKGVEVHEVGRGDRMRVGEVEMEVLWPEEEKGKVLGVSDSLNEQSVVLEMGWREFEVLLTGDIGEVVEEYLGEKLDRVEVLKVGHHGSKFSSSEKFLEKVRPEVAVIQVGKNSFGHPTDEVLERLEAVGARVFRNDKRGEVEVVSDGERWWVEGE